MEFSPSYDGELNSSITPEMWNLVKGTVISHDQRQYYTKLPLMPHSQNGGQSAKGYLQEEPAVPMKSCQAEHHI